MPSSRRSASAPSSSPATSSRRGASRIAVAIAAAAAAASLLVGAAGRAEANGRSPASVSAYPRTGSSTDVAVWTTWGLLISRGGGGFRWMCENALKVGGAFDPDMVFRSDGSLLATSFEGLLINRDGCVFGNTSLGVKFVTTVAEGPDGAIYAGVVEINDAQIYKSTDGGATFAPISSPGKLNDWWESLEVAPSRAQRVYLSGFRSENMVKTHLLFRSDDGGATFTAVATPQPVSSLSSDLEIAAISPENPDVLFVRVTYAEGEVLGDRFFRSADAGATWTEILYVADSVPGFVARRGSDVVLATSTQSGTWRSTDDGATFTKQAKALQNTQCLTERADGALVVCAYNFDPDLMAVGTSTDGETWTKLFRFAEAVGPVDCATSSLQCSVCQLTMWCSLREQFGIAADPTTCAEPGGDGTTCGGPLPEEEQPDSDGGCCGVSPGSAAGPSALLLGLFVAGALRRKRPSRARRAT